MALRGQLLERSVVIPCEGDCLDGIYLRGSLAGLLIAAPLPDEGGSMASPVSNELAYAAARSECASLRLDYRGVGGSEGSPPESLEDAASAHRRGRILRLWSIGHRSRALVTNSTTISEYHQEFVGGVYNS